MFISSQTFHYAWIGFSGVYVKVLGMAKYLLKNSTKPLIFLK